jgi:hypothetical protein
VLRDPKCMAEQTMVHHWYPIIYPHGTRSKASVPLLQSGRKQRWCGARLERGLPRGDRERLLPLSFLTTGCHLGQRRRRKLTARCAPMLL